MTKLAAVGSALGWGIGAVAFGLLPVWTSALLPKINADLSFSEVDLLKSGSIIIFSITLTISILIDYYMSNFKHSNKAVALLLNVFFPSGICICGMLIHVATILTRSESLNQPFVLRSNLAIAILAVTYCVYQKILLVLYEAS